MNEQMNPNTYLFLASQCIKLSADLHWLDLRRGRFKPICALL